MNSKKVICTIMMSCVLVFIGCSISSASSSASNESVFSSAVSVLSSNSNAVLTESSSEESEAYSVQHYTITGESVIFITGDGTVKAVTENGEVYLVKDPIEEMMQGTGIKDIYIEQINDEPGYIVYNQNEMFRMLLPITCDREDAPEVFANYYFASKLYNGKNVALSGFKINSITIRDGGNEHLIQFAINYDITPARYAELFSWYDPYSTDFGLPKMKYGLTAEVTLIGTDGMWMPISSTCPETYDVTSSKKPLSKFVTSQENRYILFETDGYTYYCEVTYKEAEDGRNTTIVASLNAYNHKNGEVKVLLTNKDDQSFYFLDSTEDNIILTSILSPPEASPYDGSMYVIHKNTQKVTEIDCLATYAVTEDGIYYAQDYNDQYSPVLYFYSYKTGEISVFPEAKVYLSSGDQYGQEYDFCYYDGKVLWTKGNKWYQLNQETKQVSEYVWK